jgi:tetratricopeptide (TPR) repeat protein
MLGSDFDSLTGQWATQGLRLYMHLRLMTQPKLKIAEIYDEYFSAFGPAADVMERYFSYWEQYAFENQMRIIELYRDQGWRYRIYIRRAHEAFPEECFKPAEELLKQALELTRDSRDPQFAQRVQFIQIGLDHARLTRRLAAIYDGEEQVPEEKVEKAKKALRKLVEFRKEHEHTFFSDLLHVTSFWERPHINLEPLMNVLNE